MSDRLAISATFSVLMMAIYVLFGANVERVPLGSMQLAPSFDASEAMVPSARLPIDLR